MELSRKSYIVVTLPPHLMALSGMPDGSPIHKSSTGSLTF